MFVSSLALFAAAAFSPIDELPRRGILGAGFTPVPAEVATKLQLKPNEGAIAAKPVPGSTAEKAGLQEGDVLVAMNGKSVGVSTVGATVRELPSNKEIVLSVRRDGKPMELRTILQERPRDPGNANYDVIYSHVVSHGLKMRTIITRPKSPGKHPGFFFIQGYSPISYDYTLESAKGDVQSLDGPLLFDFANSNFVTLRVEKPGVGDSEGGPFADLDYTYELDIYRQALMQLKEDPSVDANNVFIFGHSMGGAFGPMVAAENHVKGIAVYGTAARTWFEYFLDTIRYQGLVAGDTFEAADENVRQASRLLALVFLEKKSVDEVKKSHPQLAPLADALFPGGMFSGKTLDFWRQLQEINFPSYWIKCNTHVLAVHGGSDFVCYDADHQLIADVVNRAHSGWGKWEKLPNSDHLFHDFPSERESQANFGKGKYTPAFSKLLRAWIDEVMKAKD